MKRILLLLLCAVLPVVLFAQATRPVRGVVFDAQGTPMAGATVTAVGSAESTTSKVDGTFEMMVSPYTKFVQATKEGLLAAQAEIDGSYLVFKLAVDKKYLENKAKAEAEARLAAEAKAKAEAEARLAEEKRLAAEKAAAEKAEQERLAAAEKARLAEEKRIAAEKLAAEKAEAARIAAEEKARLAEEKRIAAEKLAAERAEAARLAAEEKARLAEEKKRLEEEKRLAAEKAAAERARLAEEKRLATEKAESERVRVVAEADSAKKAEMERLAAEEKARLAEEKRLAAEKAAAEKQLKMEARNESIEKWKSASLKGYRSYIEAAFMMDTDLLPSYLLNYIGGYQINNCLFVGAGTGLYIDGQESERYERWSVDGDVRPLSINLINVPVFAYFRANFANRRCTPFFALAAGYRLSTNRKIDMPWGQTDDYWTYGMIINPQLGVNFRITPKCATYIAVGGNVQHRPVLVPGGGANADGYYDPNVTDGLYFGFDLRVGFTF